MCELPAAHHSSDTVTVFHGAAEPVKLCGYHAQSCWLSTNITTAVKARSEVPA